MPRECSPRQRLCWCVPATECVVSSGGGFRNLPRHSETTCYRILPPRAFVTFAAGVIRPVGASRQLWALRPWGPNSPWPWAWGAPFPLLRLPCSLRSHPRTAPGATGERCPPTAGFFVGYRRPVTMADWAFRHFHRPATALPDTRFLGSLQKTAIALGLSHPTTAQPNFLQTLPAKSGVGVHTRYARRRCPQHLPPPP